MRDAALHAAILDAAEYVRRRLSDANVGSTFAVTMIVTGRLNSSDGLMVSYEVSKESWNAGAKGNALTPVVDEFLRRLGWDARHSPKALPAPEEPVAEPPPAPVPDVGKNPDDDIPF